MSETGRRQGETEPGSLQERSLAVRIGRRLRARRKELELTLSETAERSGLSISYLSAVEKGTNLPSLPTLVKITDALETTIPTVLLEEGANRVRQGHLPEGGGSADLAHGELHLEAVALRSLPGEKASLELPSKDHDVFCYVLDGELAVVLDDREAITLRQGDALDVRSVSVIWWSSPVGALALWTSCPVRV